LLQQLLCDVMRSWPSELRALIRAGWQFTARVGSVFMRNQGLLLAGAVAYYMLLSIIPLLILLVLALSPFLPEAQLLATLGRYLDMLAAGHADPLVEQLALFLGHRQITGGLLLLTLVFSSSLAFTVLEKSMAIIFHHRVRKHERHWLTSALIPYAFILLIGVGLVLVTVASGTLEALGKPEYTVLGRTQSLAGITGWMLYGLGLGGEILLLSAIYMVMPAGRLSLRHALMGGLAAGLLWETTRHLLTWFFATLSKVGVLYGSFATAISLLLSFEIAATVLLVGAQVIAVYEQQHRRAA
jgi:YihY family inner membrane protein